jgi:hypothetical protein
MRSMKHNIDRRMRETVYNIGYDTIYPQPWYKVETLAQFPTRDLVDNLVAAVIRDTLLERYGRTRPPSSDESWEYE